MAPAAMEAAEATLTSHMECATSNDCNSTGCSPKIRSFFSRLFCKNTVFHIHIWSKNHILKISILTKFTFSKSHFSQIHTFKVWFFTKFTFFKHQNLVNFWIETLFWRSKMRLFCHFETPWQFDLSQNFRSECFRTKGNLSFWIS